MKKDIEWLKKEVLDNKFMGHTIHIDVLFELMDELDEPEVNSQIDKLAYFIMSEIEGEPSQNQGAVDTAIRIIKSYQNQEKLSQKWIDEHEIHYNHWVGAVPVTDLQNLLVPKQEEIVVPEWFAKWYEDRGYEMSLYGMLNDLYSNFKTAMMNWSEKYERGHAELQEVIALIKLRGKEIYEVEEEQKYIVSDKSGTPLLIKTDKGEIMSYDSQIAYNNSNGTIELTEQEIKDYDPRYWAFRKPVEELE